MRARLNIHHSYQAHVPAQCAKAGKHPPLRPALGCGQFPRLVEEYCDPPSPHQSFHYLPALGCGQFPRPVEVPGGAPGPHQSFHYLQLLSLPAPR